jgi:hypothetical protein
MDNLEIPFVFTKMSNLITNTKKILYAERLDVRDSTLIL